MEYYSETADKVLAELKTNANRGLTAEDVEARQKKYGANALTPPKMPSVAKRLFDQVNQPLLYVLLLSATLAVYFGEYIDASVIYGVVAVNALMGFYQEDKALKALMRLSQNVRMFTNVLRDGQVHHILAEELVPGDIVLLYSGDKVPADMRLITVADFKADEAPLTGESVPVAKQIEALKKETPLGDRTCMVFASTYATFGAAKAVVTETGDNTQMGKIASLIQKTPDLKTPLTLKIEAFSQKLLWLIVVFSVIALTVGVMKHVPFIEMFMSAVAMAVAAIPEGLPAAMTIILAIGVGRMLKENAIVRKLPSVETLGSTSVICSDKTGTLTQNKMTVQQIVTATGSYTVSGTGYDKDGAILDGGDKDSAVHWCLKTGAFCNTAAWKSAEKIDGDPTEVALLVSAYKGGIAYQDIQKMTPEVSAIPFESAYKYMATLRQDKTVYVKGSVDAILPFCTQMMNAKGGMIPLNQEQILKNMKALAGQGLRVLGFAIKHGVKTEKLTHADIQKDLVFVGMQAMLDPPRPEATRAIEKCHEAGITIKMITGDYGLTAVAIAKQMGLTGTDKDPVCLEGTAITKASDEELKSLVLTTDVFARVSPEDKLRLVKAIQKHKKIVAMTGDGVNDAPALKQANIGVAMGITGTDVAKESADIVLMDDNFATIERAVEQGRGVFDNLVKFIIWTLPTSFAEALIVFLAVVAEWTIPMSAGQILWINMVTTILLGMMFSFDPIEKGIMTRKPRKASAPIISKAGAFRIVNVMTCLTIASFWVFALVFRNTQDVASARTAVVNTIVMTDILFMFACRSWYKSVFNISWWENKYMLLGAGVQFGLQLAFTYVGVLQLAFKTAPLNLTSWAIALTGALFVILVLEVEKAVGRLLIKIKR